MLTVPWSLRDISLHINFHLISTFCLRVVWNATSSCSYFSVSLLLNLKCSSRFFKWSNSCLFDCSFILTRASNDFMILKLLVGIRFYVTGWLMYTNVSPITLDTLGRVLIDWRTVLSVVVLPSLRCVTPTKPENHNHTIGFTLCQNYSPLSRRRHCATFNAFRNPLPYKKVRPFNLH